MGRSPCCAKEGLNRGAWTAVEDKMLTDYIKQNGEGSWRNLPKRAGLKRCGKSCRLRWLNYLRPDIKRGNITHDEEELIIRLHKLLGNRWSLIAGRLPGRTDNEIKNYWNTNLSKRVSRSDSYNTATNTNKNKNNIINKKINRSQPSSSPPNVVRTKAVRCTRVFINDPSQRQPLINIMVPTPPPPPLPPPAPPILSAGERLVAPAPPSEYQDPQPPPVHDHFPVLDNDDDDNNLIGLDLDNNNNNLIGLDFDTAAAMTEDCSFNFSDLLLDSTDISCFDFSPDLHNLNHHQLSPASTTSTTSRISAAPDLEPSNSNSNPNSPPMIIMENESDHTWNMLISKVVDEGHHVHFDVPFNATAASWDY